MCFTGSANPQTFHDLGLDKIKELIWRSSCYDECHNSLTVSEFPRKWGILFLWHWKCLLNWQSTSSWICLWDVINMWRRIINRRVKHPILSVLFSINCTVCEIIYHNKTNGSESLCRGIPIKPHCYQVMKLVFSPKLLVLSVLRQADLSHVANTARDTLIRVRNLHMKIPEDYNGRWYWNRLRHCDEVLVWQCCHRIQTV
jgi:hypothetical protein